MSEENANLYWKAKNLKLTDQNKCCHFASAKTPEKKMIWHFLDNYPLHHVL